MFTKTVDGQLPGVQKISMGNLDLFAEKSIRYDAQRDKLAITSHSARSLLNRSAKAHRKWCQHKGIKLMGLGLATGVIFIVLVVLLGIHLIWGESSEE